MENVIEKKRLDISGIVHKDLRGAHTPGNRKTDDEIDIVWNHLLSIPTYESHYSRRDLKLKYPEKPVSRRTYEREFHKLDIKIKQPNKDTCQTFDKLAREIDLKVDKTALKEQLDLHHIKAYLAYKSKANDKDLSKNDPSRQTITFDMQQCLPTPVVKSSLAFYKRQLWTFNFTVHDCDSEKAHCYM
ncbi:unnamed protein product [Psylliodes chrysocephalus]|uniref:Uncharacterized protein n=1 Tax=Psylliodes chrysocephalus TaxID=3402493 RepID=A0A9P0GFZ4_9CUCU|nr:unnamed protein product [Psylliodes chrysocephala]